MHTITPKGARPLLVGIAAACAVMALAACGSSTDSRRVTFIGSNGDVRFDTASITVTHGDTLQLTVGNRTDTRQEFRVEGLGIERTVPADAAVTVDIRPERSGTYRMSSTTDPDARLTIVVPN
jgi:hypothetical protein